MPEPTSERLHELANAPDTCDCKVCYGDCQQGLAKHLLRLREWKDIAQKLSCILQPIPHEGVEIIGHPRFQRALRQHLMAGLKDVGAMVAEGSLAYVAERDVKQRVIDAAKRDEPMCRDCADENGRCPNRGNVLCDPFEAALERLRNPSPHQLADALEANYALTSDYGVRRRIATWLRAGGA